MTAYLLLILPSANRVYADVAVELTVSELEVFNQTVLSGRLRDIGATTVAGLPYVGFTADELSPADLALLSNASGLYALFAVEGADVLLRPVVTTPLACFDDDLITIPKYAGKTNEQFTHLLLNVTVLSSASAPSLVDGGLRLLDPLCGRGTTLNQAMVYGYDVAGIELDGKDVEAYAAFLKTYLQRKRVKHRIETVPVRRERRLIARRVSAHITPPHAARDITLDVVHADTTAAGDFFKPASFDAIVTDAPYGVQHGSRTIAAGLRRSPLQLLQEAVPGWVRLLRPGGALGMAWNTHVAKREDAAAVLASAGLRVLEEGPYGRLRHRVDQSITRDILVGIRT
jgi:SAM-dependent methyltransferase